MEAKLIDKFVEFKGFPSECFDALDWTEYEAFEVGYMKALFEFGDFSGLKREVNNFLTNISEENNEYFDVNNRKLKEGDVIDIKQTMKEKIEQYAKGMLENLEAFLPVDKAMEISNVKINSHMKYVVYVEELENYDSPDNNVLLEEFREYYDVEPAIKEQEDNEFEVEICNAPTYIELLRWIKEN